MAAHRWLAELYNNNGTGSSRCHLSIDRAFSMNTDLIEQGGIEPNYTLVVSIQQTAIATAFDQCQILYTWGWTINPSLAAI